MRDENFPVRGLKYIETLNKLGLNSKFTKFLLVGGLNSLFGYSVFALFIFLKFHFTLATLIATILGVFFNFKTTGKLVFNNNNNLLIFKFIGVYIITYLLNIAFLAIFRFFKIDMFIAGALLIFPMAVISFLLNRKFVFKG